MTLEEFVLEVMDRLEMAQGLAGVEICRSGTAAPRRCLKRGLWKKSGDCLLPCLKMRSVCRRSGTKRSLKG